MVLSVLKPSDLGLPHSSSPACGLTLYGVWRTNGPRWAIQPTFQPLPEHSRDLRHLSWAPTKLPAASPPLPPTHTLRLSSFPSFPYSVISTITLQPQKPPHGL